MPKYVLAKQLAGKTIITSDGEELGKLVDLMVSENTGKLETIVIEINYDCPLASRIPKNDSAHGVINYDSVMAVSDYVIVDKRNVLV